MTHFVQTRPGNYPPRQRQSVSARVLRYALWFIDARWDVAEVALLFDIDPDALEARLEALA